ncbi:MAG: Heme-binding protein precursor [Pseudomonadota bacterium]
MGCTKRYFDARPSLPKPCHHQQHRWPCLRAYEGLVRYDKNYKVEPSLATSWSNVNPTTVRFNLRKNVKFHDGSNFTADDVVFSFDRIRQPQGTMAIYVAGVKEMKKVDDHTLDVILDKPNPTMMNNFTTFLIMSKSWATKNKSEKVQDYKAKEITYASNNTNGTGPYVIKEWQPDQKLVMTHNKAWWDKLQGNVTDVIYTPIKSDPTRIAALLAGNVDAVTDLPTQDVARLRSTSTLSVLDGPEVRTIFFGLDLGSDELKYGPKGKNPFKDVRVRKALSMSIDRVAIQRSIMRGLSIPASLIIAPGVNGYTADMDKVAPVDVEGAKKLLAEAGYPATSMTKKFAKPLSTCGPALVSRPNSTPLTLALSLPKFKTSTLALTCWVGALPPTMRNTHYSLWS